ncbi:DUF3027 domain-containing protein [Jatrophihabitans sp. DSM 45814]
MATEGAGEAAADTFVLDAECAAAVELARSAAIENASETAVGEASAVGEHLGVRAEGERLVTHAFAATLRGYVGWFWAVTLDRAPGFAPTVAEVVLLPGDVALLAPPWVPWSERVQPGDLSPGDVLPTAPDDPRLVPAYLLSDDPQVTEVAFELGVGRVRVLSRFGRLDAADRWTAGPGGPDTPMARQAPAPCGTCGFFLPLAGSLSAAIGVCANPVTETDGQVVTVDHGCGAHSEAVVEPNLEELGAVFDDDEIDVVERDDLDSELGEPAADLSEQAVIEIESPTVDTLHAADSGAVDADHEAPDEQLGQADIAQLDQPTAIESSVEQPAPSDAGQDSF